MLRALLDFASTGTLGGGTFTGGGFDRPFEEAVARTVREAGFHAHSQVGVAGFRIDLGVIHPSRPGEYIFGIECDGAAYHSARSARDRDRLRQEVLESMGWRLHRIWSTDWFRNPRRETNKLLAAIASARTKIDNLQKEALADDELTEAPEAEDEAEPFDSDDSDASSCAIDYEECALSVPVRRDLLELSISEVARIALVVVEAEGPIHSEEVARRIREAFGLQKTGRRILERVRAGLKYLAKNGGAINEGDFWSPIGRDLQFVRRRRKAALPLRRAAMIAPSEYKFAISTIVSQVVAISPDDLIVETARLFGFDRTGPDLKEAIDQQTKALIETGRLRIDDGVLQLDKNATVH
jgi:very-short-patch-repair endonuclease